MTVIREWAASMCAVGIGCALLSMLCPQGAMRRVFGVLTAVFFLCCLLTPLRSAIGWMADVFSLPEPTAVSQSLVEEVDRQAEDILNATLLRDAQERVGETATVKKAMVCRDTQRKDGIYIERVRVTLAKEDKAVAASVRRLLEQAWGTVVEVYYVE